MQDITYKILSTLFENEKAPFNGIQKQTKISPRILGKYLKSLVNRKLILEEGRENWKQGKKLWYSLTRKGQEYFYRQAMNDVAEVLKKVHNLTKHLSNTQELSKLRAFLHQSSIFESEIEIEALKSGTLTLEQLLERFEARSRKTPRGLLTESLKAIYGIFLEVSLRPFEGRDLVMGITKEGNVYLIPVGVLKQHGLAIGL